ncbi:hypothetical protein BV25DRAFT_1587564 [Artomyces pyxidatus]|uniref:Uncharacterized protein n=1 Tax=Artomyces pyxidatus TaxID=48021 RepID=A0ACB8T9W8_9AGAM|nr:hypothetical protein BV25DRAFT_1587564 [Artomyces pyxidatus]
MPRLPPELLLHVFRFAPLDVLLVLRRVSKLTCTLSTPIAFRVIRCITTVPSMKALKALLAQPNIAEHVQEIDFHEELPIHHEREWLANHVQESLAGLNTLPALRTLSYNYHPYLGRQYTNFYGFTTERLWSHQIQVSAIRPLFNTSTPYRNLHTLRINNIIRFSVDPPAEHFVGLRELCLSVARTTRYENDDMMATVRAVHIPRLLQSADATTLTSLTLHQLNDIRVPPGIALSRVRFPHLARLTLQHAFYGANTGPEPFIVAHAASLVHVELHLCKILFNQNMKAPTRTWADVYGAFREKLVRLRQLKVTGNGAQYAHWDEEDEVWVYWRDPEYSDRDAKSLKQLMDVMAR